MIKALDISILTNSRAVLYLCFIIALTPILIFDFYGFYRGMDTYGKLDAAIFSIIFFIILLVTISLSKWLFSTISFYFILAVTIFSKASQEYYLFYNTYISYEHLSLFNEFVLAIKNFITPSLFFALISFPLLLILFHKVLLVKVTAPPLKILIPTLVISSIILLLLSAHNEDRYKTIYIIKQSEKIEYIYSYENPVMYFFRSFPLLTSSSEQKSNAKFSLIAKRLEKKVMKVLPPIYQSSNYQSFLLNFPGYKTANSDTDPLKNTPLNNIVHPKLKNKNVIIIVLESFRSYELTGELSVGKNLELIAEHSINFTNAYSTARATIKSEQAILCSSIDANLRMPYSIKNGIYKGKCLPKILEKKGYETYWFHGNTKEFYNRTEFHPSIGFNKLYSKEELIANGYDKKQDIGWGIPDSYLYEFALNKLKNSKKPFFAEILTVSSHQPFDWNYGEFNFPKRIDYEGDDIYKNYQKSLYFSDDALGNFWHSFLNSPLKNNTIIVFTGDHGVPFYPQDNTLNEIEKFNILFKVPLMIYHPEKTPHEVSFQTSHLDITPTLLSLMNISESNSFFGRPLLGKHKSSDKRPIFHMNMDSYGFRYDQINCVPKVHQCINGAMCYQDSRFSCPLNTESDAEIIRQSEYFMEYVKLLTEALYVE